MVLIRAKAMDQNDNLAIFRPAFQIRPLNIADTDGLADKASFAADAGLHLTEQHRRGKDIEHNRDRKDQDDQKKKKVHGMAYV
jgi:hypothetical protein